jgi:hypothetical protein
MLITSANAKIGQVVKLVSQQWGDSINNPIWGRSQGEVQGKITHVYPSYVRVSWDNGQANVYEMGELEEIAPVLTIAPAPVAKKVCPVALPIAVQVVVATEFVQKGLAFSAYDVTSKLRREVNEGRIAIENRATEDVNGIQTQKINHDEVRTAIRDYMDTQTGYNRVFNGTYFIFTPNGSSTTASTAGATVAGTTAPSLTITPTGSVSTAASAPVKAVSPTAIKTYIQNKTARSLKQIQSRFKVEGAAQPTVRELAKAAMDAGLRIDVRTPYYASVVTL